MTLWTYTTLTDSAAGAISARALTICGLTTVTQLEIEAPDRSTGSVNDVRGKYS